MRAELPWNVAGIPPEAREAARAAARREGLTVGEWLTRHILRSFSSMDEDGAAISAAIPAAPSARASQAPRPAAASLDSWGLPQSTVRDSEEMLARVGRSESESSEAWRRIEEQLRGIGRRLDSSERSHSESNRFLSRTAQEMNVNAREQAQAFEQLGQNVRTLRERLERLERGGVGDNIREAIKALHQGLSRLADQLTANAGNSASQIAHVTANLEKLASHVGKVWEDADNSAQLLEQRIDLVETEFTHRLQHSEQALDARLSAAEKTVQFNTNALDHALEKIEAAANERAIELAGHQRRAAQHEEGVRELKHALIELEARLPGARLEARLAAIETSIQDDPARAFGDAVRELSGRLERLEKDHAGLTEEARTETPETIAEPETAEASTTEPFTDPFEPATAPIAEAPAIEPAACQPSIEEPEAQDFSAEEPVEPPAIAALDIAQFYPQEPAVRQDEGAQDFAPPQESRDIEPYPEFDDVFAEAEPDQFFTRARLSAQAASDRAESERVIRLSSFHAEAAGGEEKAKPRYLIPALVAALVVIMAGTALIMSQRVRAPEQLIAASKPTASPVLTTPPAGVQASALPLPQALTDKLAGQTENNVPDDVSSIGTQTKSDMSPAQSQQASAAPVTPDKSADASTTKNTAPKIAATNRVALLANVGNPVALAILGLKALDAGTAATLPDAVKFLSQAADKGQAVAQYRLGTMYERGQGVAADSAKAIHWYEMAAGQGNRKAMHNLAVAYASGPAAKRNMPESARWFAKAAGLGLSDSQFNLAVLYERGEGVPQSLADAYKWYAIAAATGDAEAKTRMGVLETQLNATDRAAASKSATSFRAAPLNRSANVPPEPADLGG
jgi:localization factor PodJL